MSDLRLAVARAVAAERVRAGLTQDVVAERMGWARSTLTAVEAGTRVVGVHELPALCEALGVDLARLLVGADQAEIDALGL